MSENQYARTMESAIDLRGIVAASRIIRDNPDIDKKLARDINYLRGCRVNDDRLARFITYYQAEGSRTAWADHDAEWLRSEGEASEDQISIFEKRYREKGSGSAWSLYRRMVWGRRGGVCWALKKNGERCLGRPVADNGRCKFHGGYCTGPRTAKGKARIVKANKKRWALWRHENGKPAKVGDAKYLIAARFKSSLSILAGDAAKDRSKDGLPEIDIFS